MVLTTAIEWLDAEVAYPRPDPHPAMRRLADDLRAALRTTEEPSDAYDHLRAIEAAARDILSYSGPVNLSEDAHEGCAPADCYVAALRRALSEVPSDAR